MSTNNSASKVRRKACEEKVQQALHSSKAAEYHPSMNPYQEGEFDYDRFARLYSKRRSGWIRAELQIT